MNQSIHFRALGILYIGCTLGNVSQAQTSQTGTPEFQFYLSTGSLFTGNNDAGFDALRRLDPESSVLSGNYPGYNSESGGWNYSNILSFGASFKPFKNEDGSRRNVRMRVGLSSLSVVPSSTSYFRESVSRADTLISASTGRVLLLDSVRSSSVSGFVASSMLYLDMALVWESDWESRWTGYVGGGLSFGISTSNVVNAYRSDWTRIQGEGFWEPTRDAEEQDSANSTKRLGTAYGLMINAQAGLDWRLANSHPFWSRTSLYFEARPNLQMIGMSNFDTALMPGWISMFGIRIRA